MFDLRKLFTKDDNINAAARYDTEEAPRASSFPIGFDPKLIAKLKGDHEDLISYFNAMINCALKGNDRGAVENMLGFKNLLTSHLITENTKLYMFLHYAYKNDPDTHQLVNEFRREMVDIGKVVTSFINRWSQAQFTQSSRAEFVKEANTIAEALLRRITTEEERLYEIYEFSPAVMEGMPT